MPNPKPGEKERDFISRCIPYVLREGTAAHQKQAVAICYSIWRRKGKGNNPGNNPGNNNSKLSKKDATNMLYLMYLLD